MEESLPTWGSKMLFGKIHPIGAQHHTIPTSDLVHTTASSQGSCDDSSNDPACGRNVVRSRSLMSSEIRTKSQRPKSPRVDSEEPWGDDETDRPVANLPTREDSTPPAFLEGTVKIRKSRTCDNLKSWRAAYVVLDMRNGGTLSCYKQKPPSNDNLDRIGGSTRRRSFFKRSTARKQPSTLLSGEFTDIANTTPRVHLPSHVNWVAKDIRNNSSVFIVEIPSDEPLLPFFSNDNDFDTSSKINFDGSARERMDGPMLPEDLERDVSRARARGQNFRLYVKCSRTANEKVLWLRALERTDRFAPDLYRQPGLLRNLLGDPSLTMYHSRIRSSMAHYMAREGQMLDANLAGVTSDEGEDHSHDSVKSEKERGVMLRRRNNTGGEKEYLVTPQYAYRNRWMTDAELRAEMMKPSTTFYDLRPKTAKLEKEDIGMLKVEILQCMGLPPLDFATETDAVAYMVCGSYAFTTDVIFNRLNPMWLPRTRRACIFPLRHAYARLFVGLFDDDGKGEKDDFAGRVVIDLARLRPSTVYDVTLPLRLSAHEYSREPRGSVRLRFSLHYHSERDAVLSYLPRNLKSFVTQGRPDDTTIICADEKAFRNVAITVHGIHLPGQFSTAECRAAMREVNFTRKVLVHEVQELVCELITWKIPAYSIVVFCSWMHAAQRGAFSLVPLYLVTFLLLLMLRTYVLFGSDGPIQKGFVPPSWEELFWALLQGGHRTRIEPLKLRYHRTQGHDHPLDVHTHKQRGAWLFSLLGIKNHLGDDATPTDYDMEIPYSQGLKDPVTGKTSYPKLTVKESLVPKTTLISRTRFRLWDSEDDNLLEDEMEISLPTQLASKLPGTQHRGGAHHKDKRGKFPAQGKSWSPQRKIRSITEEASRRIIRNPEAESPYDSIPERLIIPEQDAAAKDLRKQKKLDQAMEEMRDKVHQLTLNMFNDRTHIVRRDDATYFGQARSGRVQAELDRLLNIGEYSTGNPFLTRVGRFVQPIISAIHSGHAVTRAGYNIMTWRDPILSFWFSLWLVAIALVLAFFPWRLFFFSSGFIIMGPQNYIFRVLHERGSIPLFIQRLLEAQSQNREVKSNAISKEVPKDQPVICAHTSTSQNNSPHRLSMANFDDRDVQEVVVPYSPFMYQRMYDWPPEPKYARCDPEIINESDLVRRVGVSRGVSRLSGVIPGSAGSLHRRYLTVEDGVSRHSSASHQHSFAMSTDSDGHHHRPNRLFDSMSSETSFNSRGSFAQG